MHDNVLLTVHHVGGREGHGPFALPDELSADSPIVFYEADPAAVEGMGAGGRPTIAIGKCIGKERGRAIFNITRKPHASSLLLLNERFANAYFHKPTEEPVWGKTFAVVRRIEIETESLDAIVGSGEFRVNAPDVLTLDTEGTEYEILEGASGLLEKEIVCVVAEVAFFPIRVGQKLYGDVSDLLQDKGFIPIRVTQHGQELSLYRAPVGLRGDGIETFADAVFLKDPNAAANTWTGQDLAIKLRKLAIAALTFGQLEYAIDCLRRARIVGLPNLSAPPQYWSFLDALEQRVAAVRSQFLPVAGWKPVVEVASADEPGNVSFPSPIGLKAVAKRILTNYPDLYGRVRVLIDQLRHARRTAAYFIQRYAGSRSAVERLLAEGGFSDLSERVRLLRLRQTPWIAKSRNGHEPDAINKE